MKDFEQLKEEAKQYVRYEKDRETRIATITFAFLVLSLAASLQSVHLERGAGRVDLNTSRLQ